MKVIYISTEISPIAKVGGLADVTLGLSRAIQALGNETIVILPKHSCLKTKYLDYFRCANKNFTIVYGKCSLTVDVWEARLHNIPLYFLDAIENKAFFDRSQIYGFRDDILRFSFFSLAAIEFIHKMHSDVDLIHINEWHTALVAPIYKEKYQNEFKAKIVSTIHNMNYQGVTGPTIFEKVGLNKKKCMQYSFDPKKWTKANLIKSAIHYSDFVTTVSPRYLEEIKTPSFGKGLEEVAISYSDKITGILNGIDYEIWNPMTDQSLAVNYSLNQLEKKRAGKDFLRRLLNIPIKPETFLVICICRLVPQKGIHMIKQAIEYTEKKKGQFILFGSSPIDRIQEDFNQLKEKYADNPNIKFIFDSYNEELSHQIYAGADILIAPSLFEPCGLTQLIALRYGTVPVVRKTGGLADTVFDIEFSENANGFTFLPPTRFGIESALERAFEIYLKNPALWEKIIKQGMSMDYSWKTSAEKYYKIYSDLLAEENSLSST